MGPEHGDQDQWIFPAGIELTKREKRMIIAMAIRIAVLVMFRTHTYTFVATSIYRREVALLAFAALVLWPGW